MAKATFEITANGTQAVSTTIWNRHIFDIVDKVPAIYRVWNIGKNMGSDEYIPMCMMLNPCDPECFDINPNTLKAIRLPKREVLHLRDAAHYGIDNLEKAEKALAGKSQKKRSLAEQTIDLFRKITIGGENDDFSKNRNR